MKTTEKLNIHLQVEALAFLLSADLYLQQECPLSYGTLWCVDGKELDDFFFFLQVEQPFKTRRNTCISY